MERAWPVPASTGARASAVPRLMLRCGLPSGDFVVPVAEWPKTGHAGPGGGGWRPEWPISGCVARTSARPACASAHSPDRRRCPWPGRLGRRRGRVERHLALEVAHPLGAAGRPRRHREASRRSSGPQRYPRPPKLSFLSLGAAPRYERVTGCRDTSRAPWPEQTPRSARASGGTGGSARYLLPERSLPETSSSLAVDDLSTNPARCTRRRRRAVAVHRGGSVVGAHQRLELRVEPRPA